MKRSGIKRKHPLKPRKRSPAGYEGPYGPVPWREGVGRVCECCGQPTRRPVGHHVITRQAINKHPGGGLIWDPRNRMTLDGDHHERHHTRSHVIALARIPDSAYEFACDLFGAEKAYEYLRRTYSGEDRRLDALLANTSLAPDEPQPPGVA